MEILEHFAKISLLTTVLGRQSLLTQESVDKLFEVRGKYGITSPAFRQADCPITAESGRPVTLSSEELEEVVERAVREITKDR
jgi:hypothetical protein